VVVLDAWGHLQRIRQEQARMAELPIAYLHSTLANIHRSEKQPEAFKLADFCLFKDREEVPERGALSAAVAAAALALRQENLAPPIVLAAWPQILEAAKAGGPVPAVRALRSDDQAVWVLAPTWEGANVRGGLVCVARPIHGEMVLRDLDRPLLRYRLRIPDRRAAGWLEADLLLAAAS
jgi:hypothetical protein